MRAPTLGQTTITYNLNYVFHAISSHSFSIDIDLTVSEIKRPGVQQPQLITDLQLERLPSSGGIIIVLIYEFDSNCFFFKYSSTLDQLLQLEWT